MYDTLTKELHDFIHSFRSVILSTIQPNQEPLTSYAPIVWLNQHFYILISSSAPHYFNLIQQNPASMMLIEDEKEAKTIFARNRFQATFIPQLIEQEQDEIIQAFKLKFNEQIIHTLLSMNFYFFELKVLSGIAVFGFGKAYCVNANLIVTELIGVPHTSK